MIAWGGPCSRQTVSRTRQAVAKHGVVLPGDPIWSLGMATTTTLRPDISGPTEVPLTQTRPERDPAAYRAGRPSEDRLVDLLAFALATDAGHGTTPEAIEASRQAAQTALSDHAFRYLHNSIEQIRAAAVAEERAR